MKILIATGIYPPEIGGPAQYAFNLEQEFKKLGHVVRVLKFSEVRHLPSFIRHLVYFVKLLPVLHWADWCLALDTFSVALPAVVAGKLFGKKVIIRTGGDFLWENYVERTGDLVLFRSFYQTTWFRWNLKEKAIFKLTRWLIKNCFYLVFNTDWQRQIWQEPYQLNFEKTAIVENFYGPKEPSSPSLQKNFLAATRSLKWKNLLKVKAAFLKAKELNPELVWDDESTAFNSFVVKLSSSYAVILVSLGDIGPNLILDAIRYDRPFILTQETGLYNRLKDIGVFVDPENAEEIKNKILWLADSKNHETMKKKIEQFTFVHDWPQIAQEFLTLSQKT